jgi:hypothetical protein
MIMDGVLANARDVIEAEAHDACTAYKVSNGICAAV